MILANVPDIHNLSSQYDDCFCSGSFCMANTINAIAKAETANTEIFFFIYSNLTNFLDLTMI